MRKTLLTAVCALFAFGVMAQQWNQSGDYKIRGKVGIGVPVPKSKLDIRGSVFITGSKERANELIGEVGFCNIWTSNSPVASIGVKTRLAGNGACDYSNIVFETWNGYNTLSEKMRISSNGNVGIGIDNPIQKLDVRGNIINGAVSTSIYGNHYLEGRGSIIFLKSYGNHISSYNQWLLYSHTTDGTFRIGNNSSSNVAYVYRFTITKNGNVGIGISDPGSYKLAVKGKVGCNELVVTDVSGWADFVFDSNYDLMSLSDLDAFIKANKHLPEIPTTKEVVEQGISVGGMNAKLLQKIEELTLYVIELKKENQNQDKLNNILQKRIEQLENK